MRSHLLVTNDFPPKVGGIQSYLWELWRRLPAESTAVMCTPYDHSVTFDAQAGGMRIERSPEPVLLPYPWLGRRVRAMADEVGAELIMLDPAVPLGMIGPGLGRPYGVVLHGAEVTIPGRVPLANRQLARVLKGASLVVSAGEYALAEAERCAGQSLPAVVVPPGVDTTRFTPPTEAERMDARRQFGFEPDDMVIASVNRLVPRKGMDMLIAAVAELLPRYPKLRLVIGGTGRSLESLQAQAGERVEFLGRIDDQAVTRLYQAADMMGMLCHDRLGGLEQEGFGIVFLEAAACGIPQIAGRSGGAAEAVEHKVSGLIVDEPRNVAQVVDAITALIDDPVGRAAMGAQARQRAVEKFDYDVLAARLAAAIDDAKLTR